MRKSVLLLVLSAICLSGCFGIFKPKPIAGDVEEGFRNRWIAKRMGELQANGKAKDPREARAMALDDFKKTYPYTKVANKPDPMAGAKP